MAGALSNQMNATLRPIQLPQTEAEKLVRTYDRMVAQDAVERGHIVEGNKAEAIGDLGPHDHDPLDLIFQENLVRANAISFNHLI